MATNELKLNLKVDDKHITDTHGIFSIQPLDRGFGITLGNALRRVLLTSIPGAAITNVKIDGILHEFSTIKGIKDDVADILMNLKSVRFKLLDNQPDKIHIKLKGKHVFSAKDIQAASDQYEILNPDHYITELNGQGELDIELWIGVGKGYVTSEENEYPNSTIGMISLDSIFNPVTKVTFNATPLPGAKEDREKLTIEVHTDGSISPKDAISHSAHVINEHVKYVEAISKPEILEVMDQVSEKLVALQKLLNSTIDEMELSVRSYNCLQAAGIEYIYELVSKEENEMLKYKNFGRKSLTELIEKLGEMGLSFGMDVSEHTKEVK
ncbi:MAG TPA: DNA-directed RNA polymerase subunit alpha [Candidatus Marinimicrobia bacterium]|jgi:DNA-directed RNA polymerase subunit alpha|nr:DNA-directed RNA polymerase subunit alpha [Candidatus Neomarinimicrobiota bacterium]|tara:strand:- start:1526 stop:2500 length:975 start_codon:yes stop_codon:yes gene_type:complete